MEQALNNGTGAVEAYRKSLAAFEELAMKDPANTLIRNSLARTNRSLAIAYVQLLRDAASARPYSQRGLEFFEQISNGDPADADARIALADGYYSHGFVLRNAGEPREALRYFDRAIEIYDRVSRERATLDPALARTAHQLRADALFDAGEYAKAIESSQKVLAINAQLLKLNPDNASAQRNQGIAYSQIAKVHAKHKRWREARAWYQRELDILEAQQKKGTLIPMYVRRLDAARKAVTDCDAALAGKP
jgi:tetratricopeptide (TPR) repeat protein